MEVTALEKAKVASPETGIEIRQTFCAICCANMYCGVDAYVKDGRIIKVEGTSGHIQNKGKLCVKGYALRDYVYSGRRLKTPLRRVGERGEGKFEPITWQEAYAFIAQVAGKIKRENGPESLVFFAGYDKWFRPMLHRLANAFGTPNYGTESSACAASVKMACFTNSGTQSSPDLKNCRCYLGFSFNQYYSRFAEALEMEKLKDRGVKFITIDPRNTPTSERMADLHLRIYPGTDGALAHCFANLFIQSGWADKKYIDRYVHGYEEYAAYVAAFTPEKTEQITGVPKAKILAAVQMLADNRPFAIHESVSPIVHHRNGFQNYRAMLALSAIAGCYDVPGGNLPRTLTYAHQSAGFSTREIPFVRAGKKKDFSAAPPIGSQKFPLWAKLVDECQMIDFPRQVLEKDPYPVKGMIAFGHNIRMLAQPQKMIEAIRALDFYCVIDLFHTDAVKYADIVLPACSSVERDEFKIYRGGYAHYVKRAIEPLHESRSDDRIITELARALDVKDDMLYRGYDACVSAIIGNLSVTLDQLKASGLPILVPEANRYRPGTCTAEGYKTPTGKFELYSTLIGRISPDFHLDPLPTYQDSCDNADPAKYPFILFTGSSLPFALHSRTHDVPSLRCLRQCPTADLNPEDAIGIGVAEGDKIALSTDAGAITVCVHLSPDIKPGTVSMYHGYREADVNSIIPLSHVDPYSGFCGFKSVRCQVRKVDA